MPNVELTIAESAMLSLLVYNHLTELHTLKADLAGSNMDAQINAKIEAYEALIAKLENLK